ncbi:MAG TPA: ElyC/SanA/YdcF family protein [Gaiellaceae bacterium]|nr:ElyC/SanA/YdcF family protein [Gaiellaceae bacterium]
MTAPAIVVPGSTVSRVRERLVREAERVACNRDVRLVVFSGAFEAGPMRDLWHGPDVELVLEDAATTTAENAANTLPLLLQRDVREVIVVCAPVHLIRARWIFRRVYGARGVSVRFRPARIVPTPGAIAWELGASVIARRQVRAQRDRS